MEETDQSPCTGGYEVVTYRRRDECAGIDQELGTRRAREALLAERVEAVAVGIGSHPDQPAVVFIRPPRQQRGVIRQELTQSCGIIVMDDAAGLGDGPLESSAASLFDFVN